MCFDREIERLLLVEHILFAYHRENHRRFHPRGRVNKLKSGGDAYADQCPKCFERKDQRDNLGAVNTEIVLELADGTQIVSIITKASAKSLGLKKGKDAYAVIKASSVMIATD